MMFFCVLGWERERKNDTHSDVSGVNIINDCPVFSKIYHKYKKNNKAKFPQIKYCFFQNKHLGIFLEVQKFIFSVFNKEELVAH